MAMLHANGDGTCVGLPRKLRNMCNSVVYEESRAGSDSSEEEDESELSLVDEGAPARALAALNALRKSRQHYDVVLVAGGAEVPAHRAVLAAASPYLLRALPPPAEPAPLYRVADATAAAVRALVDYAYSGRLPVRDAAAARDLYRAAWTLRLEPARAHLAERLLRRLAPAPALAARQLPGLAPAHTAALDRYLHEHFHEVCDSGALAQLPQLDVRLARESSTAGGREAAAAVAGAALAWLRGRAGPVEQLCARPHLLFVDRRGELRDCGELPAARGEAPELRQYRDEGGAAPGLAVGSARAEGAVLGARRGPGGATRALLALGGRLLALRVAWSDVAGGAVLGGALGGERADGERRARMAEGRCAHGAAELDGRLLVLGGYDRARVLRSAEAYCPREDRWAALPALPAPRARFPAARLGGAVWALGGSDGHAELDSVAVLEAGGWRARARLPQALSHAGAAADEAGGALFVLGGWAAGGNLRRVLRYRPPEDGWEDMPPLAAGRAQCGAVWWGDALWALGGCDAWHCLASTERLPAGAPAWEPGPALPTARRSMGACSWRGRLVAAGGSDGAASLRRTDWLEPGGAAGWRAGPALQRARAGLALVDLQGTLYAVGGFDGKDFLACVETLAAPDCAWTELRDTPRPACALQESTTNKAEQTTDDDATQDSAAAPELASQSTPQPAEPTTAPTTELTTAPTTAPTLQPAPAATEVPAPAAEPPEQ